MGLVGLVSDTTPSSTSSVSQERSKVRFLLATSSRYSVGPSSDTRRRTQTLGWKMRSRVGGTTSTTESSR
jgi:hypothetical protein